MGNQLLDDGMIHICYAIYDKTGGFSKFAGTSICSLFENTKSWVTVHLLHDNTLTMENKARFIEMTRSYGQYIQFYDMEKLEKDALIQIKQIMKARFSPATFYRLFLGRILSHEIPKIIYLDVDTIVNFDIAELWGETTGENGLAAVSEKALTHDHMVPKYLCHTGKVKGERYFNAGVLLMDMDKFRQQPNLVFEGMEMLRQNPACDCYDQDILNYYYADRYCELPLRYDVFVAAERLIGRQELQSCLYHYAGLALDVLHPMDVFNRLFFEYFRKTPWCSVDFLMRSVAVAHDVYEQQKNAMRQVFNLAAHRRRIFWGNQASEKAVRTLFAMKPEERYLVSEDVQGHIRVDKLLEDMCRQKKGRALYVIFMKNYTALQQKLKQAGFAEYTDFVDGLSLLKAEQGGETLNGPRILQQL